MDLLLKRNETTNLIGLKKYNLFAKLELEPEELERVRKARPDKCFVWEDEQRNNQGRWRLSLIPGGLLAIVFGWVVAFLFGMGILLLPVAILMWVPFTKLIFNQARAGVTIANLIVGRTIHCKSLDELYTKEHAIKEVTQNYCKNLEGMHALGNEQRISMKLE